MRRGLVTAGLFLSLTVAASARTVVFWDDGFPAVDTAAPIRAPLAALPDARLTGATDLPATLPGADLLVLPYGSAFPEQCWPAVYSYLQKGGNLLVLGGRAFTVPVYRDGKGAWCQRSPRKVWAQSLYVNDYTETPGSAGLQVESPELSLPGFEFTRSWSLEARLSAKDLYKRIGSAGTLDTRLDTLQWGCAQGRKLAAPVVELDHLLNNFVGGRWVLVDAQLQAPLPADVLGRLAERGAEGAREAAIEPVCALCLPGEAPRFHVRVQRTGKPEFLKLVVQDGSQPPQEFQLTIAGYPYVDNISLALQPVVPLHTSEDNISLSPPATGGLHTVVGKFYAGTRLLSEYRSGYWVRDPKALETGPVVTVDQHYFKVDGRTQPIVGSTYMASDVQRQFLMHPNPLVWDRDFAQMKANGVNMIRTGLWSCWDQVMRPNGDFNEDALRNLEAFMLTARSHQMPVQFNFFAFIPDAFGGANPYLDPAAVKLERHFVSTIVARFAKAPWLMWDLINEPSFDKPDHLWATRANGDPYESKLWNDYVLRVHGDLATAANAWNSVPGPVAPVPTEDDFSGSSVHHAGHPLMVHDFYLFAQEQFVAWARGMREAIRATGSQQLITVGQDEGGGFDRLNPSYWMDVTDFTTNHSWWQADAALWDSLVAIQPGKPALIQETGVMPDLQVDSTWRKTPLERAAVLEKKCGVALSTTSGVIQWLWNVAACMTDDGEVTIGAVRPDGTEKPEADVMRGMAAFANANRDHFRDPAPPDVAIVFDHDLLYSPFFDMATVAQRKAVRVIHQYLHVPALAIAQNRLDQLASWHPKLAILPSPMVLDEAAWKQLLDYVRQGGTLLVNGSCGRDPYWPITDRLKDIGPVTPLNFRHASMTIDGATIPMSFGDQSWLDYLPTSSGWTERTIGKGRLLVSSFPVELSDGNDAVIATYAAALKRAGVEAPFTGQVGPAVLVRPVVLADSILYLLSSESGVAEPIDLRDRFTGAEIKLTLPPQRTFLVLIDKHDGHRLGGYPL